MSDTDEREWVLMFPEGHKPTDFEREVAATLIAATRAGVNAAKPFLPPGTEIRLFDVCWRLSFPQGHLATSAEVIAAQVLWRNIGASLEVARPHLPPGTVIRLLAGPIPEVQGQWIEVDA